MHVADRDAVTNAEGEHIDQLAGVVLGTAVGDALGLPREGLSRRRASRLFGDPPLRHTLLFSLSMVSDDAEHACMTGRALLRAPDDVDDFARSLAWRLRFWLAGPDPPEPTFPVGGPDPRLPASAAPF